MLQLAKVATEGWLLGQRTMGFPVDLFEKILGCNIVIKYVLKMIFNGFILYLRISLEHLKEKNYMIQEQETFEKVVMRDYGNITGIVVCKDGEKVYENYFNECTANSRIHIYSVTKSIISILIGITMDKMNICEGLCVFCNNGNADRWTSNFHLCLQKNELRCFCRKCSTLQIPCFGNGAVHSGAVRNGTGLVCLDNSQKEKTVPD